MLTRVFQVLVIAAVVASAATAAEPPLHFWLSTSSSDFAGPSAPEIELTVGSSANLYLWCRPSMGANVRNFSLHVVANQSGADLVDGTFTIFNSSTAAADRFEFVTDSSTTPPLVSDYTQAQVTAGNTDRISNLQGFTIIASPTVVGLGPSCLAGDTTCGIADDGGPAWLLGTFEVKAVTAGTNVELFLQVGDVGMNQRVLADGDYDQNGVVNLDDYLQWDLNFGSLVNPVGDGNGNGMVEAGDYTIWRDNVGALPTVESTAQTGVQFGMDDSPETPPVTYNGFDDRGVTLAGDTPDAVIVVVVGPGSGAVGTVVPEPSAIVLVGCWIAAAATCHRPKRRSAIVGGSRQPRLEFLRSSVSPA